MKKQYVSQIIDEIGLSKFTWMVYLVLFGAMIFDGLDYMVVSFTMPEITKEWHLTKIQTGSLASWGLLGLVLGGAFSGIISDRIGRKKTLFIACLFYSLVTGMVYFANNFETFAILRVIAGFGLGAFLPVGLTMISEFVPSKNRGAFVASSQAAVVTGWVVAGLLALPVVPYLGWRACYLIGDISFVYAFLILMLPESVQWLLNKGQKEKAASVIRRIEKVSGKSGGEWSAEELVVPAPGKSVAYGVLFSKKYLSTTIMLMIVYFMAYTSVYGISSWMPTLLNNKGMSITVAYWLSIALNFGAVIGNIFTGWISDKLGRKRNIVYGFISAVIGLVLIAYASGTVALALTSILMGLTINYALTGVHPLATEMYSTECRNRGVGLVSAVGRFGGFLAPLYAGFVQQQGANFSQTMLAFAIFAVLGALAAQFMIKQDTTGKTFEDIEKTFDL